MATKMKIAMKIRQIEYLLMPEIAPSFKSCVVGSLVSKCISGIISFSASKIWFLIFKPNVFTATNAWMLFMMHNFFSIAPISQECVKQTVWSPYLALHP